MRKIRFRGRVKSDDPVVSRRWAYGHYCQVGSKHFIILDDTEEIEDGIYGFVALCGFIEVDPETVGEYIGVEDDSEKQIYEGDNILYNKNFEGGFVKTVEWDFQALHNLKIHLEYYPQGCTAEVIGNVHEGLPVRCTQTGAGGGEKKC